MTHHEHPEHDHGGSQNGHHGTSHDGDPGHSAGGGSTGTVELSDGTGTGTHRVARVVVASNRAAAGVYEDTTGPLIEQWLQDRGWVATVFVVADGDPVGEALRDAIAAGVDLVVTTGGTGASPTDRTPEKTRAVIDFEVPGIAEEIRRIGAPHTPKAVLSRGLVGVAGTTVVVNLPGSTGGVRDGLGVLDGVLVHLIDQIHGGDHARTQ